MVKNLKKIISIMVVLTLLLGVGVSSKNNIDAFSIGTAVAFIITVVVALLGAESILALKSINENGPRGENKFLVSITPCYKDLSIWERCRSTLFDSAETKKFNWLYKEFKEELSKDCYSSCSSIKSFLNWNPDFRNSLERSKMEAKECWASCQKIFCPGLQKILN